MPVGQRLLAIAGPQYPKVRDVKNDFERSQGRNGYQRYDAGGAQEFAMSGGAGGTLHIHACAADLVVLSGNRLRPANSHSRKRYATRPSAAWPSIQCFHPDDRGAVVAAHPEA